MAQCLNCRTTFDVDRARERYNDVMDDEGDYDADHGGALCFDCAIPAEVAGQMDHGLAIMMVNGDADYDDDFVQENL